MAQSFIPYITEKDYLPTIQEGQLNSQILESLGPEGFVERQVSERWAMAIIRGRIGRKYDLISEFTPTLPFVYGKTYTGGDRCTLDFPEFDIDKAYVPNDLVVFEWKAYICITASNNGEFENLKWKYMGERYEIFYIPYPAPLFSLAVQKQSGATVDGYYQKGDIVFWAGKKYEALRETTIIDRVTAIQHTSYSSIPASNVFPNDVRSGTEWWKSLGSYSVIEVPSPDSVKWVKGDNRSSEIVQAVIVLTLWMLHKRISPDNIPKLRQEAFKSTMEWLDMVKDGEIDADVTLIQPAAGGNISWGSKPKLQNGY